MENNVAEKIKANKKTIIIAAVAIVVVILIAVIASLVKGGSYKSTLKKFEKAMESEESMEKFVDKNVNLRAFYAISETTDLSDKDEIADEFVKAYKKAKKSDYMDDEIKDTAYSFYKNFVDEGIEITKIGNAKSTDKLDVYGTEIEIKGLKVSKITIKESDGDSKMDADAYFYKGKLFIIIPDLSSIEY